MSVKVGSYEWVKAGQGNLTVAERMALLSAVSAATVTFAKSMTARILGRAANGPDVDPERLLPPDSALVRRAETQAVETLPDFVLAHSYRTFFWGAFVGTTTDLAYDAEALFVAAILHDSGLTEVVPNECFTLRGGRNAEALLGADGGVVADAITMHCNPVVTPADGAEAYLAHVGAAADVAGLRYEQLAPAFVRAVVARHPRHDFKRRFAEAWKREGRAVPRGRARYLSRYLMLPLAIRLAPFDE